jgi:hypothetical protein
VKFHLDEWIMRRDDLEAHVSHEIERNEDCVLFPGNPIKKKKKEKKKTNQIIYTQEIYCGSSKPEQEICYS